VVEGAVVDGAACAGPAAADPQSDPVVVAPSRPAPAMEPVLDSVDDAGLQDECVAPSTATTSMVTVLSGGVVPFEVGGVDIVVLVVVVVVAGSTAAAAACAEFVDDAVVPAEDCGFGSPDGDDGGAAVWVDAVVGVFVVFFVVEEVPAADVSDDTPSGAVLAFVAVAVAVAVAVGVASSAWAVLSVMTASPA
jgi:hypothetical protein